MSFFFFVEGHANRSFVLEVSAFLKFDRTFVYQCVDAKMDEDRDVWGVVIWIWMDYPSLNFPQDLVPLFFQEWTIKWEHPRAEAVIFRVWNIIKVQKEWLKSSSKHVISKINLQCGHQMLNKMEHAT